MENVNGGVDTKKYVIETTGSGVAIIDYDNDGWPDIFLVNCTTLDKAKENILRPSSHLFHNTATIACAFPPWIMTTHRFHPGEAARLVQCHNALDSTQAYNIDHSQ